MDNQPPPNQPTYHSLPPDLPPKGFLAILLDSITNFLSPPSPHKAPPPTSQANQPTVFLDRGGTPPRPAAPAHPTPISVPTLPSQNAPAPTVTEVQGYKIQRPFPLTRSYFYEGIHPAAPQELLLMHEIGQRDKANDRAPQNYPELSTTIPHVLPHKAVLWRTPTQSFVVLRHPGSGWRNLSKIATPLGAWTQAVTWVEQIGQALAALHQQGYGGWWRGLPGRESIIISQEIAYLSDLTFCLPLQADTIVQDCRVLTELLYYLTTGQSFNQDPEANKAPAPLRPIIRRGAGGHYSAMSLLLEELKNTQMQATFQRPLRSYAGSATHPGRERDHNEDFIAVLNYNLDQSGKTLPSGLFIVADGMGGQEAGEKASRTTVRQAFLQFVEQRLLPDLGNSTRKLTQETPAGTLKTLVQQANNLLYQTRRSSGSDRGTTMTAALIIGNKAVIANVGDSRTYLWRQNQFAPITKDHSLVASLVKAGHIQPHEIYTHPQRNQIYRSLGDKAQVEIDIFEQPLAAGDRLLLCSDGLWEMVRDPAIAAILATSPSPQLASDRLIEAANANGGEDNISVIVVNVE